MSSGCCRDARQLGARFDAQTTTDGIGHCDRNLLARDDRVQGVAQFVASGSRALLSERFVEVIDSTAIPNGFTICGQDKGLVVSFARCLARARHASVPGTC